MFDPKLRIEEVLKNSDIVEKFKCGNMGGMRRSKTTNTLVIVSDYTSVSNHCICNPGLLLKNNKRSNYNLKFVNDLVKNGEVEQPEETEKVEIECEETDRIKDAFYIYNDYSNLLEATNFIKGKAFSIGILGCGFDTLTEWVKGKYNKNIPKQYINLGGKKVFNIEDRDLMSFYVDKASNNLDRFASQFNCQGLELDYSIVIWGNMMLWRGDHWKLSEESIWAIDNYIKSLDELKKKDPDLSSIIINKNELRSKFIENSYRVLLTRARIATYVYISDMETYEHVKSFLHNYLVFGQQLTFLKN